MTLVKKTTVGRRSGLRLVVLGMMGRSPFGGQAWLTLNWLLALSGLGHDVWYVEDDTVWPYDPRGNTLTDDLTYPIEHIKSCLERIGLGDRWGYRFGGRGGQCAGLSELQLDDLYRTCDALISLGGATWLREEHLAASFRVYIETDPVIAELQLADPSHGRWNEFAMYHRFVTYGENFGAPDCSVPLHDLSFGKTRQPIALEWWPYAFTPTARNFTTIGNYRQDGHDVTWQNEVYRWSKHHEWERFVDLPCKTNQAFELALQIEPKERSVLELAGWGLVPSLPMSLDVFGTYRSFIQSSRGEFTVAKDQNVRLRSGWFSERDACYLASGKPVIAQDTGFGNILPVGEGLFAFSEIDHVLSAIDAINSDYEAHCRAARAIAEEYFEAGVVAARLLSDIGLT